MLSDVRQMLTTKWVESSILLTNRTIRNRGLGARVEAEVVAQVLRIPAAVELLRRREAFFTDQRVLLLFLFLI